MRRICRSADGFREEHHAGGDAGQHRGRARAAREPCLRAQPRGEPEHGRHVDEARDGEPDVSRRAAERREQCAGTERLRVAVRHCTAAGGDGVPGASSAAGVGDGAAAYADVDAAVAERVFDVAGDDQREIDKLTALQGYVCAVRPETPGCERR
ncbi:lysozyme [Burkholderia pseudomallei]|uniref:lysozyme n=1 Tax=Burkholderia pseudomallei TaxID=28450 RepID=UPI0039C8DE5D